MKMNKLVSVNITTYNRAHLLSKCLNSVLAQSYDNMEIIIVDDCSTDRTVEVVEEYKKIDGRIKYIKHEINRKLPSSRNTAWTNSKGKYIAFMDDDDEWIDNDKIKKQVNIFENSYDDKLVLISTSVRLYKNNIDYIEKVINKPKNLKSHILGRNGVMYTPTVMVKKEIIEKVGGFDINLSRGIDSDFYRMCIVKFDYNVHFMPDITTSIHEYGNDRITPTIDLESIKKTINANIYLLKKYNLLFLYYPMALLKRLRTIQIILTKYLMREN